MFRSTRSFSTGRRNFGGIKARPEYARLAEIAALFAGLPLQLMRSFFDDFVQARLEDSVSSAFLKEYERVM